VSWTVSEIAELIRRPDADKQAVIERLRVWTDDGLLAPEGKLAVGTGRARMYDRTALQMAAVLNVLADFGMPVRKGNFAAFWHFLSGEVSSGAAIWAKQKHELLHLEIADFGETDVFGRRYFAFLHRGPGRRGHVGQLIHMKAESSHVINLTRLFARIEARETAAHTEVERAEKAKAGPHKAPRAPSVPRRGGKAA
jgi:hypothetical protein